MYLKIFIYSFFSFAFLSFNNASSSEKVPNIVGTWIGENKTISEQRGFRTWEKKVEIIDYFKDFSLFLVSKLFGLILNAFV